MGCGTGEQADIDSIVAVQMCYVVKGGVRLTGLWASLGSHLFTRAQSRPFQKWISFSLCSLGFCCGHNVTRTGSVSSTTYKQKEKAFRRERDRGPAPLKSSGFSSCGLTGWVHHRKQGSSQWRPAYNWSQFIWLLYCSCWWSLLDVLWTFKNN